MWKRCLVLISLLSALLAGCGGRTVIDSSPPGAARPDRVGEAELKYSTAEMTVDPAEPNGVVTLEQVLVLTLLHHPELKAYSLEMRAAEARALQAGLRPNPALEIEMEGFGGSGDYSGFGSVETAIQLSQTIELGDQAGKRKRVAGLETALAGVDYRAKRRELLGMAAGAYYEVWQAQEQMQLARELMQLAGETLAIVQKRVAAGRDSPLEQSRAAVALAAIRVRQGDAERDLKFAREQLAACWGQERPVFARVEGVLDAIEPLPEPAGLLERLKRNPDYTRWETEIARSQAALELENARALGEVTVSGGLQRFNDTDDSALILGIAIPLPVADRNQGGRQEAAYKLARARHEQKAVWLALLTQFNAASRDYANALAQVRSLQTEALPGAQALFEAAMRAYQEGKADYLSVLDGQRTLFDLKASLIESRAACHAARIDLARLTGLGMNTINNSQQRD